MNILNKSLLIVIFILAFVFSADGRAQTSYELVPVGGAPSTWASVDEVGVHTGVIFVNFTVNGVSQSASQVIQVTPTSNCLNGIFYIDINQPHAKSMHQQLLLAKTTGKRYSRVGFQQTTQNGMCMIWLLSQKE